MRAIRDDARDPGFLHRFDVTASATEGLVLSFVARYIDGEGRTADERLEAIEVSIDGAVSRDGTRDLGRLGIGETSSSGRPDSARVDAWKKRFTELADTARAEAERRAAEHLQVLGRIADDLGGEEREALGEWRSAEKTRIERISFGGGLQVSFDQLEAYEERAARLDAEHERRLSTLRDRSEIRLASLELLGGRLLVWVVR